MIVQQLKAEPRLTAVAAWSYCVSASAAVTATGVTDGATEEDDADVEVDEIGSLCLFLLVMLYTDCVIMGVIFVSHHLRETVHHVLTATT